MNDPLTSHLKLASHFEKVMLKGLWANGDLHKHLAQLRQGEHIRVVVPATLPPVTKEVTETHTIVDIAQFKADRANFYVYGSMRPYERESWVLVGRIN